MATAKVGFKSLGCPKATVDSEHIVTELLGQGYEVVAADDEVDVVVVNTCGFIDSARDESMEAIGSALAAGKQVVATGCLGSDQAVLKHAFPQLQFISGPAQVAPVVSAVQTYQPLADSIAQPPHLARTRLTPEHYAYIKISEGCNHKCSFCIIPDMRGALRSRALDDIAAEAQVAVDNGAKELLLIAQDLSAYGVDLRYPEVTLNNQTLRSDLYNLANVLGDLAPWVRLHYVYPYPSVDALIPLMSAGKVLPYLDIPLQHASPRILKAMRRPAAAERTLERIARWREICPEMGIRSTFIVGFPGETPDDVGVLLDFLEAAQLDRVGCFTYSAVDGARANALPDPVDEQDKLDRQEMVYEIQAGISAARLQRHVGSRMRVLVDEVHAGQAVARSMYDAPDIDGQVFVNGASQTQVGEFAWVEINRADDHDLHASFVASEVKFSG